MRKKIYLGTVVLPSVFFFACLLEEEAMPVPFPLPPPSAQQAVDTALPPPPAESTEPAPVAEAPKVAPAAPAAPAPKQIVTPSPSEQFFNPATVDDGQLKSGRYTIQVAVFPSETSAKNLVKKMASNGINSYYVKVNNPAQLLGIYYRVRVGYFNGRSSAEAFAKSKLEPLGYAWYVDASRNDAVGNPNPAATPATPVPVAPVASSAPAPTNAANAELEKAKQEYKEIAKQAAKETAKQVQQQAPPPPKAPQIAAPPPPKR